MNNFLDMWDKFASSKWAVALVAFVNFLFVINFAFYSNEPFNTRLLCAICFSFVSIVYAYKFNKIEIKDSKNDKK